MDEYYPKFLKNSDTVSCNKCKNDISIKKILMYSYINECQKCQNMGTYNYNNDYFSQYNVMPNTIYEDCKCTKEYIYKRILTCKACTTCVKCLNQLTESEIDNLDTVYDENICKKCK